MKVPASVLSLVLALGATHCGGDGATSPDTNTDTNTATDTTAATDTTLDTTISTAPDTTPDTDPDTDPGDTLADGDAQPGPTCDPYPLVRAGDATARTRAEAALAALAPDATLTWSDARGTLSSITGLDIPLADCAGSEDAYEHGWDVVLAHPDLFQLDRDEWHETPTVLCSGITDQPTFLNVSRATLGGQPVLKDIFVFVVARRDGVVTLTGVNGFYLPATTTELTAALASCPELDTSAALAVIAETPLPFAKFAQCVPTGEGTYTAHVDDTIDFDDPPSWVWDDAPDGSGVVLLKQQFARLVVAPANRTDELMASDANCPADPPAEGRIVGFRIQFDVVTGELVFSLPGIGCIVC